MTHWTKEQIETDLIRSELAETVTVQIEHWKELLNLALTAATKRGCCEVDPDKCAGMCEYNHRKKEGV